jgi:hypothetical protein
MKKNTVTSAAVIAAPAAVIAAPAPAAPAPLVVAMVDGKAITLESMAKLERDWSSACGRIHAAVDSAAQLDELETSATRRKSGITAGKDGTRRKVALVNASASAVDKVAKHLVEQELIGQRDADLWKAYVRLSLALESLAAIGRL